MNHGWRIGAMPPTQHCIVFPSITGQGGRYFLDTGIVLEQHTAPVVISDVAAKEIAKAFGFISRGEAERIQEVLDKKEETINELLQKVDDLEKFKSAVTLISAEKKKAIAAERAVA